MEEKCKINLVITVFVGVCVLPVGHHEVMMMQIFPNVVCLSQPNYPPISHFLKRELLQIRLVVGGYIVFQAMELYASLV